MGKNMDKPIETGTIVYSVTGRDSGRFFVVTEIVDDKYIKVADGDLRRIDKPKLKQSKHVKSQGVTLPKITEKLIEGKKIFDAELKSALKNYNGSL
jgi:ribosomal protein L14E/L6E/L27E